MATVLYGGERELNLFTAGEPHPSMLQYMRETAQQIGQYAQQSGSQFAQGVVQAYESYYSDDALRHARAALSRVDSYFQADKITTLSTIYQIQQAQPVMQRFIMSEPTLRQMYHDGRCSGYQGSYVDPFPGQIGEDDYNYRRVMDGLLQLSKPTEDMPHGDAQFVIYVEELMEGDRPLEIHEQSAITETWRNVRYALAHSLLDPSSKTGESL